MTPMTPPATATAEWIVRHGIDVLLVNGRSVATVAPTSRGTWMSWRQRTDQRTYHPTREAAMSAVTPAWALHAIPDAPTAA